MNRLLFIGDIVGEPGVAYLEERLPALIEQYQPAFIVANAENLRLTQNMPGSCGMTPDLTERLFAIGIDLLTGGNHSWDGPYGQTIHDDPRILRPLNCTGMAGRGASVITKTAGRLGVVNLISPLIVPGVGDPYQALEQQLAEWQDQVDWVVVDFHGESVTEKQSFGHAVAGKVVAVLGTHTHVQTLDTRILAGNTAYVSDVGMTGPDGGIQGYSPDLFVNVVRHGQPQGAAFSLATGQLELGAVLVTFDLSGARRIERLY